MRAGEVLLLVAAAALASESHAAWSQTALVYQVYPRSYKDSNGDGIGDLNGIREKLQHLKNAGVDAVWLSPIFLSPMRDFGYDITDYRQIAPEYGTMADFDSLVSESRQLGLRILLDFVPNHTSNESEWFLKSARREPGYEDYYVWADGKPDPGHANSTLPPSNWLSVFGGSAWEWYPVRGQYYFHQFAVGQPDLNYRNPKVREEMNDVVRFWLNKGVSGFRVDAVNHMYEVDPKDFGGVYPDEPLSGNKDDPNDYDYLTHIYTKDQEPTYNVIYTWQEILDNSSKIDGEPKLMLTEAYTESLDLMMKFYGTETRNGSVPFNFDFLRSLSNSSSARDIKYLIDKWMTYMPDGKSANWVNGNHDNPRLATRHGDRRVDGMNMLALLLPGIALTYQGEELGMTDGYISWEDTVDPQACNTDDPVNYAQKSRDPERTPYHWDSSMHAGFSNTSGKTWLPVADNYKTLNLEAQMAEYKSHYYFYTDVAALRKYEAVRLGDMDLKVIANHFVVLTRSLPGYHTLVAVFNVEPAAATLDLTPLRYLTRDLIVLASGVDSTLEAGMIVNREAIYMAGSSAVVLMTNEPLLQR